MMMMMAAEDTTPPVDTEYPCYADDKHDRVGHSLIKNRGGMTHEVCYVYISHSFV